MEMKRGMTWPESKVKSPQEYWPPTFSEGD